MDENPNYLLRVHHLDALISELGNRGFNTLGPVARGGAIVHAPLGSVTDFPVGVRDAQGPGSYSLEHSGDPALFAWAVGSQSWKAQFFPPSETLWRIRRPVAISTRPTPIAPDTVQAGSPSAGAVAGNANQPTAIEDVFAAGSSPAPVAIIGMRPCDLAALGVLDAVLSDGANPDRNYRARRSDAFLVVVECGHPSANCFCASMGSGPEAGSGFDIALTEIVDGDHRFLGRSGSARGEELLRSLGTPEAPQEDLARRAEIISGALGRMGRSLDTAGLPEMLEANIEHYRWSEVAGRCLSCGNCTTVCPTCFCSDINDVSDIYGGYERRRQWSSCFDLDHSFIHGGPVHTSTKSRYRQWMTHKLSTWDTQFGSSGCVGCGRCVTWCPVGIDIREEVAAIAATEFSEASS